MVRKEERKERNKEMKEGRVKGRNEERSWTPKFSKLYFLWSKYGPTHCINTVHSILASSLASFHCWLVEKLMVSNNMSPELLSSLLPVDIIAFFKKTNNPQCMTLLYIPFWTQPISSSLCPDHLDWSNYLYILLLDKKPIIENNNLLFWLWWYL